MCLGVPGRIIEIYQKESLKMARVDFSGVTREVCLESLPEAEVGNYVLVHVGFAISTLSEEEARQSLDLIREIIEYDELAGGRTA